MPSMRCVHDGGQHEPRTTPATRSSWPITPHRHPPPTRAGADPARNPRAAGVDPPTRLSARVAHRRGEPAGGTAGPVLAGRENHFRPTAFADRVGLPRPLPDTAG